MGSREEGGMDEWKSSAVRAPAFWLWRYPFPATCPFARVDAHGARSGHSVHVRATVSGNIAAVYVHQGDHVTAGQVLATLENPEITSANRVVASSSRSLEAQPALRTGTVGLFGYSQRNGKNRAEKNSRITKADVNDLKLRSPIDGVVATPGVSQLTGQYLTPGDEFATVVDRSTMRARILVRDLDLQDVQAGAPAKVKVVPYPFRTFTGTVESIKPAASVDRPVGRNRKARATRPAAHKRCCRRHGFP